MQQASETVEPAVGRAAAGYAPLHIEAVPGVRGGRPVVKGTRLTVEMLRTRVKRDGFDAVLHDYPQVSEDALLEVMTASTRALRRLRLEARRQDA